MGIRCYISSLWLWFASGQLKVQLDVVPQIKFILNMESCMVIHCTVLSSQEIGIISGVRLFFCLRCPESILVINDDELGADRQKKVKKQHPV